MLNCTAKDAAKMTIQEKKKLTLRLNQRLIEQAKQYATQHNISVSELVETFFLNLEQEQETGYTPLVNQLTGIIPPEIDAEQEYQRFLEEKHGS
jgi:hypothetical protein